MSLADLSRKPDRKPDKAEWAIHPEWLMLSFLGEIGGSHE
jgi:hypothetical protein